MLTTSFVISPFLKDSLLSIDALRGRILTTPLPTKTELRLRWEAVVGRIYWSLILYDNQITKKHVINLLNLHPKRPTESQQTILGYKKALDYIAREWYVTDRSVSPKTVIFLHNLVSSGTCTVSETSMKEMLDYIQVRPENPVIQAALAQLQLLRLHPFTDGNGRTSRLLALLFLYKHGFDFRGFFVLEEYWRRNFSEFSQQTETASQKGNVSGWLEYFAKAVAEQLEKTLGNMTENRPQGDTSAGFVELNDRQKEILSLLENPEESITNKKARKLFTISQITASRDLMKLAALGLLFPHGKGRSIYYTK